MDGYKAGYSEQHSPWYTEGVRDGRKDAKRKADGKEPKHFDRHRAHSVMYQRGYAKGIGAG